MHEKTRTQKLEIEIEDTVTANRITIARLKRIGPRGGHNAACIDGWAQSPHSTISKICRKIGGPSNNWWSGREGVAATAIPICIYDDCVKAYNRIFGANIGLFE